MTTQGDDMMQMQNITGWFVSKTITSLFCYFNKTLSINQLVNTILMENERKLATNK